MSARAFDVVLWILVLVSIICVAIILYFVVPR
jgi:hypothetical protein